LNERAPANRLGFSECRIETQKWIFPLPISAAVVAAAAAAAAAAAVADSAVSATCSSVESHDIHTQQAMRSVVAASPATLSSPAFSSFSSLRPYPTSSPSSSPIYASRSVSISHPGLTDSSRLRLVLTHALLFAHVQSYCVDAHG
jgi:hypothetical protein